MNKRSIVILLAVVTLCILGWLYYQPYRTLGLIRKAALSGESEALKDYVDFPSLRESIKENMNALLVSEMAKQDQTNPFVALGMMLAGKLVDQAVESFVSANSIVALTQGQRPSIKKSESSESSSGEKGDSIETKMGYDNASRFSIRFIDKVSHEERIVLYLRRHGLSWKLAAAKFPFMEELPKSAGDPKQRLTKEQIELFGIALDTFKLDVGRYPTIEEGLKALREKPPNVEKWEGPYLPREVPEDPWGRSYLYRCPGEHGKYDIISYGADGVQGGEGENQDMVSWEIPKK